MVSYFKRNYKVQRNKRQSIYEKSDPSRSEQADQSMSKAIRVEHIRYLASRLEQIELRGVIRLEKSRVKASGEKKCQIGAEQEHHGDREEPCKKRREKRCENIRAESEKSSAN